MTKHLLIFIFTTLTLTSFSLAQESNHRGGGWLGTFAKKEMTTNLSFWAETQARYNFELEGLGQILYRTGFLYNLDERQGLGFLYGYIQGGSLKEHRWTLQHTYKYGKWLDLKWSHRARLEGRFLENSRDDAARARLLLRVQMDLETSTQYVLWSEVFLNLTDDTWTGSRTDDRNRLFLGVRTPLFQSNLEVGYLNQWVWRNPRHIVEHLFVVYLFL